VLLLRRDIVLLFQASLFLRGRNYFFFGYATGVTRMTCGLRNIIKTVNG
jgi:hypothetical protein